MNVIRAVIVCVAVIVVSLVVAVLIQPSEEPDAVPHAVRLEAASPTEGLQERPGSSLRGLEVVSTRITTYVAAEQQRAAEALAAEQALAAAQIPESSEVPPQVSPPSDGSGSSWNGQGTPCAIPQYICDRESGGDPTVYNHQGSGASGKYQAMPGTWGGYAGYANAADAPESVQDQWAAELWDGGRGCAHWSAC